MKYKFFFVMVVFCLVPNMEKAQQPQTIKIRKETNLVKVVFDNTDPRLFVVDRFGNPRENKVLSYKLYVKTKRETREFQGHSNRLNSEMLNYLKKQKVATKIFFTEISAEDDDGHLVKLPDAIDTWFPDCTNCDKRRR